MQTITTSLVWKFNATPGSAADLAGKVSPRAPAPVATTWTGCYIDGGVGYGLNNRDHFSTNHGSFTNRDETAGGRGYLGKVGGGCDYQFSPANGWGNWVVGAFADYNFMDLHDGFADATFVLTAPEKESWAATVGGRVGLLVAPHVLTYVNGGWTSTRFDAVNFPGGVLSWPDHTFSGGFIGGGAEFAVAAVPGLYWRNEYRLSSYQPDNLPRLVNGVPGNLVSHQSVTAQTITTALVWKFH